MKNLLALITCIILFSCNLERIPDAGPFQCGQEFIDPRDGKSYKTIWIANDGSHNLSVEGQCWFAENANFSTGNIFSSCYEETPNLCDSLGTLYHSFTSDDACPEGWHSATQEEWSFLFNAYGWTELLTGNGPIFSGNSATFLPGGSSGINFLLGGHCESLSDCEGLGENVNYWASDQFHTAGFTGSGSASVLVFSIY